MPKHRNEGKKEMPINEIFNLGLLNYFCSEHDFLFVIKKHFYHNQEIENLAAHPHIKDITQQEYDTQQLLKHTDILITDYSSCFVDFLLLNRPVIFYNYDYADYVLNDRDLYFDYDSTTPGVKVKDFEQLITALDNVLLQKVDLFEEKRMFVKNIFYSKDNQRKVGKKILDFVKENI